MRNGETRRGAPDGKMRSRRAIINISRAFRVESTGREPRLYYRRHDRCRWYRDFMQKSLITVPRDESMRQRVTLGQSRSPRPILHLITLYVRIIHTKRLIADLWSVCEVGNRCYFADHTKQIALCIETILSVALISRFHPHTVLDLVDCHRRLRHRRRHSHCRRRRQRGNSRRTRPEILTRPFYFVISGSSWLSTGLHYECGPI